MVGRILSANIEFVEDCQNEACRKETEDLSNEIDKHIKEIEDAKKQYLVLLVENLQKDVIIERLREGKPRFEEFQHVFSPETLKLLLMLGNTAKEDSTFVLHAIRDLFKDNLDSLKNVSYTGRSKDESKTEMSQAVKNVLQNIFDERMLYLEEIEESKVKERKAKLVTHIKNAINSINKANK